MIANIKNIQKNTLTINQQNQVSQFQQIKNEQYQENKQQQKRQQNKIVDQQQEQQNDKRLINYKKQTPERIFEFIKALQIQLNISFQKLMSPYNLDVRQKDYKPLRKKEIDQIIQYIHTWKGELFNAIKVKKYVIQLKQIEHIKFLNVKQMYLPQCHICSIQSISFINAPYLSSISLFDNKIVMLKAFNKINNKNLKQIILDGNQFNKDQVKFINRANISNQFQRLGLQKFYNINHQLQIQNIDYTYSTVDVLAKMKINTFNGDVIGFNKDIDLHYQNIYKRRFNKKYIQRYQVSSALVF